MKRCRKCGTAHSREAWAALRYVGLQDLSEGEVMELRHCPCGSTIGIEVQADATKRGG